MSLRNRLTLLMVGLFMIFIWVLVLMSATILQSRLEQLLSDQQLAATRQVARELDDRLKASIDGLSRVASRLPADMSYASVQPELANRNLLQVLFSGGATLIDLNGIVIADYPSVPGRRGMNVSDRDYVRNVIATGKPYIGKPIIGRALKRPVLIIGMPVFNAAGKLRAVLTGAIDLTASSVLGFVSDRSQTGAGQYYVFALRDNLIVAATDATRTLTETPERGRNVLYDKMVDGYQGSGVAISSERISKLYSGVRVPTANWLVLAALPTKIAFAPIAALQRALYFAAAILTLIAFILIRYMVGKMLSSLDIASEAMHQMTAGQRALAPLAVQRNDEVGQLVGNFNRLVVDRQQYEAALTESEHRFRLLVEGAPHCIFVQTRGRFAYVNNAALALFGAQTKEQLLNHAIMDRIAPDYRERIAERVRLVNEERRANPAMEEVYLRLDGSRVDVDVAAVPLRFGAEDSALVFAYDITRRKQAEHVQQRLGRALRLLSECNMVLARANNEQELFDAICWLTVDTGGYLMAWVGVPEHDADKIVRVISQCADASGYLDAVRVSWGDGELGRGPTGSAIRTGLTQVNQNLLDSLSMGPWRDAILDRGYRSSIALPLTRFETIFGALTLYSAEPNSFGPDEVALLDELTANLTFGIESLHSRTARAHAESELQLTQERLQGLFDSITDAVFVLDASDDGTPGNFIEVNDVACERLGYSREELLAMTPLTIDAPECHDDILTTARQLSSGESAIFERIHLTKDGRRIPVEISASSFTLRGRKMFVSLVRDITERKKDKQELIDSADQLHKLSSHLETVREEERMHIAREMHDELGQTLTAMKMDISLLRDALAATDATSTRLASMTVLVDEALGAVRRIASDLRPTMLDDLGLKAAVEWLSEEFQKRDSRVVCKLVFALAGYNVQGELATAAYRIIQECLTNVMRHAQARKVEIIVGLRDERQLMISVHDNGRGLPDPDMKKTGFGLLGMRERVSALGGSFTLNSLPGEGVAIDVILPLSRTDNRSAAP